MDRYRPLCVAIITCISVFLNTTGKSNASIFDISDRSNKIFGVIRQAHDHFNRKQVSFDEIKSYVDSQVGPPTSFSEDDQYLTLNYVVRPTNADKTSGTITCKAWYITITSKSFFGGESKSDPFLTGSCDAKIQPDDAVPDTVKHKGIKRP